MSRQISFKAYRVEGLDLAAVIDDKGRLLVFNRQGDFDLFGQNDDFRWIYPHQVTESLVLSDFKKKICWSQPVEAAEFVSGPDSKYQAMCRVKATHGFNLKTYVLED